jgi:hypothetical protein
LVDMEIQLKRKEWLCTVRFARRNSSFFCFELMFHDSVSLKTLILTCG